MQSAYLMRASTHIITSARKILPYVDYDLFHTILVLWSEGVYPIQEAEQLLLDILEAMVSCVMIWNIIFAFANV